MLVETIRQPGQPGTQKEVARYGTRHVCIRYRRDAERHKRYKTIELIVEERDWNPTPPKNTTRTFPPQPQPPPLPTERVGVRIGLRERELQQRIKAIGGQWDPKARLWYAPIAQVQRLGLASRIVRGRS